MQKVGPHAEALVTNGDLVMQENKNRSEGQCYTGYSYCPDEMLGDVPGVPQTPPPQECTEKVESYGDEEIDRMVGLVGATD